MNRIALIEVLLVNCTVTEHQWQFRRPTTHEPQESYKYAVLGDSLVYGVYMKGGVVISAPGATIERLNSPDVLDQIVDLGVQAVAVLAGTNNLVDRDGNEGDPKQIASQMETLVSSMKDRGLKVCIVKVPGRRGRANLVKKLGREYEKVAKRQNVGFHTPKKFTVGSDDAPSLWEDGLHPHPEYLQKLTEDLFDAVKSL